MSTYKTVRLERGEDEQVSLAIATLQADNVAQAQRGYPPNRVPILNGRDLLIVTNGLASSTLISILECLPSADAASAAFRILRVLHA